MADAPEASSAVNSVSPSPEDDSADRWIDAYLDAIAAERGAAVNTLHAYRRDLRAYVDQLTIQRRTPASAARDHVEAALSVWAKDGLSPATRARRLSAVKQLHRFAVEEGFRDTDPAATVAAPKQAKRVPDPLSIEEVDRLLAAAHAQSAGENERATRRRACLMETLYATGVRVTELVSLPLSAVEGAPEMILVRGKGERERMVPLSGPARAAIAAWVKVRAGDARDAESPWLFPGRGAQGHLTRVAFFTMVKNLARAAGLAADRVSPHALRHAFATHLLQNGADLRVIQTLLGHADIAATEIYAHVLDERLKRLVLEKHPLAQAHSEHAPKDHDDQDNAEPPSA
ncbi:MAG: tyrosine recombinase [Rhodobacteraceae bacterium]|nr:tyrosine recombinase [Paracoccaceae bacterium]